MAATLTYQDLVRGFSINQLAELFEMDRRTVTDRLRDVDPSGTRASHPVYRMVDAAPKLLGIGENSVKTAIRNANEKDYWDAQLKKQKFEENAGDLWRTDKVIEVFAQVFKQFRESVVVFIDGLEHESGLPPETIASAKMFGDSLLTECRAKLLEIDTGEDSDVDPDAGTPDDDESFLSDLGLD
jgi:hypothetical protein